MQDRQNFKENLKLVRILNIKSTQQGKTKYFTYYEFWETLRDSNRLYNPNEVR